MKYSYSQIWKAAKPSDSWIGSLVINPLSYPLVYLIANYTRIRPEPVNILSLTIGILAAFFYINGTLPYLSIGALLVLISYTLDAVDGKLARLKNQVTLLGTRLEAIRDKTVHLVCFVSITAGQFKITHDPIILYLGSTYLILLITNSLISYRLLRSNTKLTPSGAISSIKFLEELPSIKIWNYNFYPSPSITEVLFVLFVGTALIGFYLSCTLSIILELWLLHTTSKYLFRRHTYR